MIHKTRVYGCTSSRLKCGRLSVTQKYVRRPNVTTGTMPIGNADNISNYEILRAVRTQKRFSGQING